MDDNTVWIDGWHVEVGSPTHERLVAMRDEAEDGDAPPTATPEPTNKQLAARLKELGVEIPKKANKATLLELVAAAEKAAAGE